jgi:hypothetical protein
MTTIRILMDKVLGFVECGVRRLVFGLWAASIDRARVCAMGRAIAGVFLQIHAALEWLYPIN